MKTYNKANVPLVRELRKNMTPWERRLWYGFLREYPIRFQRQKPIGEYIVDFYCAKARLAVELDGSQHYDEIVTAYDRERTDVLKTYDVEVLRIPNNELNTNLDGVCRYIDAAVKCRMNLK